MARDLLTDLDAKGTARVRGLAAPTAAGDAVALGGSGAVPAGGVTGQLLAKSSGTDYAVGWGLKITVGTTAPSSPATGDLWVDTN